MVRPTTAFGRKPKTALAEPAGNTSCPMAKRAAICWTLTLPVPPTSHMATDSSEIWSVSAPPILAGSATPRSAGSGPAAVPTAPTWNPMPRAGAQLLGRAWQCDTPAETGPRVEAGMRHQPIVQQRTVSAKLQIQPKLFVRGAQLQPTQMGFEVDARRIGQFPREQCAQ